MRIHIDNVSINISQQRPQMPMIAGILSALAKDAKNPNGKVCATTAPESKTAIPAIGEKWGDLDAIYAGVSRGQDGGADRHVVLWNVKRATDPNYKDGTEWAGAVHPSSNSHIATKSESALLYANLPEQFDKDAWYWTSTQYSTGSVCAQHFHRGAQDTSDIHNERRVRAVSSFQL